MAIDILMPALSPTMTEGILSKWLVKQGDKVRSGDVIAEIETDKATMEVEAIEDGIVAKIVVSEGTEGVAVNSIIAVLSEDVESIDKISKNINNESHSMSSDVNALKDNAKKDFKKTDKLSENKPSIAKTEDSSAANKSGDADSQNIKILGNRVFATPLARRIAKQHDIDLSTIKGTGPYGRIIKRDILAFSKSETKATSVFNEGQVTSVEGVVIPHSAIRWCCWWCCWPLDANSHGAVYRLAINHKTMLQTPPNCLLA